MINIKDVIKSLCPTTAFKTCSSYNSVLFDAQFVNRLSVIDLPTR